MVRGGGLVPFGLDRFVETYGNAAGIFLACTLVGLVADALIFRIVSGRSRLHGWRVSLAVSKAVHGLPTAIGVLAGLHLALRRVALGPQVEQTIGKVLAIAAILVVTAFAARVAGRAVRAVTERDDVKLPSSSIFVNLAIGLVWVLGSMSLLATLGVSIAPLITALGVGGLAVGLALQPTLENVFSGVQVLASRQIEPGDLIRLETGEEGTVLDVTWRNTAIRKVTNDVVIVPNAVIGRSRVTNFSSLDPMHAFTLSVPVPLTADPAEVERIAIDVAKTVIADVDGPVQPQEPSVRFAAYVPPNATLNITIKVGSYPERIGVRHELIKRLQAAFSEAGIETAGAGLGAPPTTA